MKKIRVLQIVFDEEIKQWEVPAFRGGIISKIGRDNVLFHNHIGDDDYRFSYPLIQYKTMGANPAVLCVEEGVDEIQHFFQNKDWSMEITGRKLNMRINRLNVNTFNLQVWEHSFEYFIANWVALNTENYRLYVALRGVGERIELLEKILVGNVLSFAKGVGWEVGNSIDLKITSWNEPKLLIYKGIKRMAFSLKFKTNVFIPNYLGLGKGASFGFGTVKEVKK